jgi:glycosyltransferase involved in cell wall biosynthesis
MNGAMPHTELSVIVPVGNRQSDAQELYSGYKAALDALQRPYQLIFVLDGPQPRFATGLKALLAAGETFMVVGLTRTFGEATAIMAGFSRANGGIIVTLPAYHQIEPGDVGKLLAALDPASEGKEGPRADLVIGHRTPRVGGPLERLRRRAFHGLLAWVTKLQFNDLACGARAFRRRVLEEISLYGDQHYYLPVLADRQGFRVAEVDVRQSPGDRFQGVYGPRQYSRSLLDIFSIFFVVRFTKRPLRFFGMVGLSTFTLGALWTLLLVIQRLFFDMPLADRPALLLSSLLLVLGLQIFAIGLLGELIIFTHARTLKDYQVAEVIQFTAAPPTLLRRDETGT